MKCIQHLKVEHFFFDLTITYLFCLNFQSFDDSNKAEHARKNTKKKTKQNRMLIEKLLFKAFYEFY